MVFSDVKNNLFKIISMALSVSALVLVTINSTEIKSVLTLISIALVCRCAAK